MDRAELHDTARDISVTGIARMTGLTEDDVRDVLGERYRVESHWDARTSRLDGTTYPTRVDAQHAVAALVAGDLVEDEGDGVWSLAAPRGDVVAVIVRS